MNKRNWMMCASALCLAALSGACVVAVRPPGAVVVAQPPPVAPMEVAPAPPGPGYAWEPGYYGWSGAGYVWYPGRYELRPVGATVWLPPVWVARRGRWVFRPGRWAYR
jgi:hypothetical protein